MRLDFALVGTSSVVSATVPLPVLADSPTLSELTPPLEGHNKGVPEGTAGTSGSGALLTAVWSSSVPPATSGATPGDLSCIFPSSLSSQLIPQKGCSLSVRTWVFVYTTPICGAFNGTWAPKLLGYCAIVLCQGNQCAPWVAGAIGDLTLPPQSAKSQFGKIWGLLLSTCLRRRFSAQNSPYWAQTSPPKNLL